MKKTLIDKITELALELAPIDSQDNPAFPNHTDTDIWVNGFIEGYQNNSYEDLKTFFAKFNSEELIIGIVRILEINPSGSVFLREFQDMIAHEFAKAYVKKFPCWTESMAHFLIAHAISVREDIRKQL